MKIAISPSERVAILKLLDQSDLTIGQEQQKTFRSLIRALGLDVIRKGALDGQGRIKTSVATDPNRKVCSLNDEHVSLLTNTIFPQIIKKSTVLMELGAFLDQFDSDIVLVSDNMETMDPLSESWALDQSRNELVREIISSLESLPFDQLRTFVTSLEKKI